MYGRAYPLCPNHEGASSFKKVFRGLGIKMKQRFTRVAKPIDHLGGISPEDRLLCVDDQPILEKFPKSGSCVEDVDILVG